MKVGVRTDGEIVDWLLLARIYQWGGADGYMYRESASHAVSRDGLGAVFQYSLIAIKISVPVLYWQDRNAQNAENGSLLLRP